MVDEDECAARLLDTVPSVMRILRTEIRNRRPADLSVPQFRTLAFLRRHEGASLSDLADHMGGTLPTMSKIIDGLVTRQFVARETSSADRRRMTLRLTDQGKAAFGKAAQGARARIAEVLSAISPENRAVITKAMEMLQQVFELKSGTNVCQNERSGEARKTDSTNRRRR